MPPAVPARARHGGGTAGPPGRWSWVEPTIWTPRMVQALEEGVKGGRWYSLWDKVTTPEALRAGFTKVKANRGAAGADHETIEAFERDLEGHLKELHGALRAGTYRPSAIRRRYIPKPGTSEKRPLGIPTVRDRVVQAALRAGIEPIFEREFADHSYGFRPKRSAHQAIDRVEALLDAGYLWVVDADLKSYFDTIPHDRLMARVRERLADGRVLGLIGAFLTQPVVDDDGGRQVTVAGTPQGAVVSPVLANLYLDPLDHLMAGKGYEMTRYADDFVIQCRSEEQAQRALAEVQRWCGPAGLTVHPGKTRVLCVSVKEGFDFLGYHFRRHRDDPGRTKKWPRKKSIGHLRDSLRPLTRRTSGHSLEEIIRRANLVLRGFFAYFRKSVRTPLRDIDEWVRGRLRAILRRRRRHLRGRARRPDNIRWNNTFFSNLGLFSLARALDEAMHSPSG